MTLFIYACTLIMIKDSERIIVNTKEDIKVDSAKIDVGINRRERKRKGSTVDK